MLRRLPILVGLLIPTAVHAQQVDEQLWLATNAVTKTGDTTLTFEAIGRFSDAARGFAHSEFGGSAAITPLRNVELAVGYRHVEDWDDGHPLPNEERLRQMVTVGIGSGFAVRMRVEERFYSTGGEVGLRVRPQLRFTRPINRHGLAIYAWHENYVNFNRTVWGQRGGLERMRNTAGLSVPLSKSLRSDIGYLNQYRFGRGGARDKMDHAATFVLTYTF